MLTSRQKKVKRIFDIIVSIFTLVLIGWFICITVLLSRVIVGGKGYFKQERIGRYGIPFMIYKIETIHPNEVLKKRPFISKFGRMLRANKIDELPQFFNVLFGTMSLVGPRPDISGFADQLDELHKNLILSIKPGITGPATLYFINEEELLLSQKSPDVYNLEVIWPKKVEINIEYIKNYSFSKDLTYLFKTITA